MIRSWFVVLRSWLLLPVLPVGERTIRKKWEPRMHANGREGEGFHREGREGARGGEREGGRCPLYCGGGVDGGIALAPAAHHAQGEERELQIATRV
jgi:hypothetical protein